MSDYKKYRESHLKAQKKYDDKNREKKHQYDKQRWKQTKKNKEVREKLESVQIFGLRSGKTLIATLLNDILEILDKVDEE